VLKDFIKEPGNDKLVVKALAIGKRVLPAAELDRLANMPTKQQAISLLLACLRAPLDKLARTLNEVPGKLVRTSKRFASKRRLEPSSCHSTVFIFYQEFIAWPFQKKKSWKPSLT